MDTEYDVVFGAGGIKGWGHVGVIQAIDELAIPIGTATGISVGAGVATLYKNGRNADQILEVFLQGRKNLYDPARLVASLVVPDFMQLLISRSWVSLEPGWQKLVEELELVPSDKLQLIAFDPMAAAPVIFKGTGYPLHKGIAASGSVPDVFAPVRHDGRLLVDGAFYHYNPTEFCQAPAIVVRLLRATRWPDEALNPVDAYYHWRELNLPLIPSRMEVDADKHIVIDLPTPDVAGLSFGISEQRCLKMVEDGYQIALSVLSKAIESGRLKVPAKKL
jgi:hypothetical protein